MKSYSPISTVSIFSSVINCHSIAGGVGNISNISDYVSFIYASEIDKLVADFVSLSKEISFIQDSTHLYDEQFGICA